MVKFLWQYFDTSKKILTLARISSRNIYLNLFGRRVASRFLGGVAKGGLLQLYLAVNVIDLVELTEPGLVWEKF